MTTIQDRIIKQLDNNKNLFDWQKPELKQFLIQSIKEVEEETRNEIAQEFLNKSPAILKPSLRKGYFLAMLILKSITNKEKQK